MREKITVFRAVFVRNLIMMRRYMANTLSGIITIYIVFMLLFLGVQAMTGGAFAIGATTLEGLVVGYLVWTFAMVGYQDLAWGITNEAQMGTLEKLYLTPIGFRWVNGFSQISGLLVNFAIVGVLLALIMLTTGVSLRVDIVSVVPLLLVTVSAAYGLGFAMGGLALIHKRIQSAFQIVQFVLVAFIAAPASPWSRLLPLNLGSRLLTSVMVHGVRLWELPPWDVMISLVVGVAYLWLGLVIMAYHERKARDRGLLGHY
ncbi:MAG: ABC transporter permease [Bacillota bacterium]